MRPRLFPYRRGGIGMVALAGTIVVLSIVMARADSATGAGATAMDTTAGDSTAATVTTDTPAALGRGAACGQLPVAAGGRGVILGTGGSAGPGVRQPVALVDPRTVPTPSAEEQATRAAALDRTYRSPCAGPPSTGVPATVPAPPIVAPSPGSETAPLLPVRRPAVP
ncbi:MAG: hypothetical protein M3008_04745 [Chloroflexota bacterium]|nr:hypothetical protein [Chloroflexota bacterium]